MKTNITYLLLAGLGLMTIVASCQKAEDFKKVRQQTQLYNLTTDGAIVGEMEVSHDNENLYVQLVSFSPTYEGYQMRVSNCDSLRTDTSSAPGYQDFPAIRPMVRDTATVVLNLQSQPRCLCIEPILTTGREPISAEEELDSEQTSDSQTITYCWEQVR